MAVVGKTIEDFRHSGDNPADVMIEFEAWIRRVADGGKLAFVGFNAAFDWSFINWYFHIYRNKPVRCWWD